MGILALDRLHTNIVVWELEGARVGASDLVVAGLLGGASALPDGVPRSGSWVTDHLHARCRRKQRRVIASVREPHLAQECVPPRIGVQGAEVWVGLHAGETRIPLGVRPL